MDNYTALTIDIKNSRSFSVDERKDIQIFILTTIKTLNNIFLAEIEKKVEIVTGDELQGLFKTPQSAFLYSRLLKMIVYPLDLHCGIGVGSWDIQIDNMGTSAQDGSAYHNARYAINFSKKTDNYSTVFYSGHDFDYAINSLIHSADILQSSFNENKNQYMLIYELLSPIEIININIAKNINELADILISREKLDYFKNSHNMKSDLYPTLFENLKNASPTPTYCDYDETFVTISGKKRGLIITIAQLFGVSRQSAEKTIKSANIFELRNIALSTIRLMKRTGDDNH